MRKMILTPSFVILFTAHPPISPIVWAEIGLGIYALLTVIILQPIIGWSIVPWMLIYMLGYFYIAGLNLFQHQSVALA